jgi:hypothetical protein
MNESVKHLVDAIAAGDALETEKAFAAAMAEKLSVKLDDMRAQVAQNMFKTEEETVVVEEEKSSKEKDEDGDDKEDDDKEDEDKK